MSNHKPLHYNQDQINENLEEVFDMEPTENQALVPLVNNQVVKKKSGRGGKRVGSGRKKGAIQKISGHDILAEIELVTGKSFARSLAEHYMLAEMSGDWYAVRDYDKMILSKVVADKVEADITSNGETLGVQLVFNSVELNDWRKD